MPHIPVNTFFSADLWINNLTCRYCVYTSPATTALVYYTPWYANDGVSKEFGPRYYEQSFSIPPIKQWGEYSFRWTGGAHISGRYIFTIIVDPDNLIGARRVSKGEFYIDR